MPSSPKANDNKKLLVDVSSGQTETATDYDEHSIKQEREEIHSLDYQRFSYIKGEQPIIMGNH